MHINVPLLPLSVEFRRRPLRPLRFSIRALMLVVVLAGMFFTLVTELRRQGQAMSYHAEQSVLGTMNRSPTDDPMPLANWHAARSQEYRAVVERLDFLLFLVVMTIGAVLTLFAIGRIGEWMIRRPTDRVEQRDADNRVAVTPLP